MIHSRITSYNVCYTKLLRYLFKEENGIAKRVEVEIGQRFDDKLEVISKDLKPGDHIVVEGQARLLEGNKVEVVK